MRNPHDPNVRLVESDEDPSFYAAGRIRNAILLYWKRDVQDPAVPDWGVKNYDGSWTEWGSLVAAPIER